VVWGEALWAATLATAYAVMVCVVLFAFGLAGTLTLQWTWIWMVIPLLFLAALAFSAIGLLFTAILPSIDHMSLPFFLVIMPIGFVSSTYFPLPDVPVMRAIAQVNPLHHLAEGLRALLLNGKITMHLPVAAGLCCLLLLILIPIDMRLLRKRVFGDG
jgi:ABC-type polysaccharide/polyol phosphate export permease